MAYKLYNYFRSSASYRVRIALHLKQIKFEYLPVHLVNDGGDQNKEKYTVLNPMRQVPCLQVGDRVINQSMAIIDFLEQTVPNPALYPTDPIKRAWVIELCEDVNSGIQPLQNLTVVQYLEKSLGRSKEEVKAWTDQWISKGLKSLEVKLNQTKGPYCLEDKVTAADLFLIPQVFAAFRFGVQITDYPRIQGIYNACMLLEPFKKAAPENQIDYKPT